MPEVHLPVTFRVKKSYWPVTYFSLAALVLLPWLPLALQILHHSKEPVPVGMAWFLVFFDIFWCLLFWWSGWIFRLDLANEGFRFRADYGNWKMAWSRIKKVEHRIYRPRGGPRVEYWVFGDGPEKPAKLRFFMFEKGSAEGFFHILKANASHAKWDEEVAELLRKIQGTGKF